MPEMVVARVSRFLPQARRIVGFGDENAVILDLCLRKTREGKSRDYANATFFVHDGLVWTVGPTAEIKPCFQLLLRNADRPKNFNLKTETSINAFIDLQLV